MSWQNEARAAGPPTAPEPPQSGAAPPARGRGATPPAASLPAPPDDQRGALCGIAEVQRETGLSARTLRYYEELGLLPGVRRRAGGRRVYGPDEIERVRFIQRLKKLGLALSDIKELNAVYGLGGSTHAMLVRLAELLDRHHRDVEERIAELALLRGEIERYRARVEQRIHVRQRATGEAR